MGYNHNIMLLRKPAVAGQFYSASKSSLEKEVTRLLDKGIKKIDCCGAISPHAGYIYSGSVAGKTLSRIKFKEGVVILGPNHTGCGSPFAMISSGAWELPMGNIDINEKLANIILKSSRYIKEDPLAHTLEHSIEMQLPLLQALRAKFSFVPIVLAPASLDVLKEIGRELARAIKEYGKKTIIIASSDMTHYERQESAVSKDKLAIDAILKLDEDMLMEEITRHDITMCGSAPTIVMITALKELGAKKAQLIDYKTSGDISGDYTSVVGYAGILIS